VSEARIIGRQGSIQNTFELRSIHTAKIRSSLESDYIFAGCRSTLRPRQIIVMKIKKIGHCCLVIETKGITILLVMLEGDEREF